MRTIPDHQHGYDIDGDLPRIAPSTGIERLLCTTYVRDALDRTPTGREGAQWSVPGEWTEDGYVAIYLTLPREAADDAASLLDLALMPDAVEGRGWIYQMDGGLAVQWSIEASAHNRAQSNRASYGPVLD